MARLNYADITQPDLQPLAEKIVAARGSVLHLYRMLMHSAPIATGWLDLLSAIRQHSTVPGGLRELVIMRVAVLNGAPYEADQHAPIALAEGVSPAQLTALDCWESSDLFSDQQRAVLALTDSMTRQVQVPDDIFAGARDLFNDQTLVELVTTIAAYNMVSRVLEALQVHTHDQVVTSADVTKSGLTSGPARNMTEPPLKEPR